MNKLGWGGSNASNRGLPVFELFDPDTTGFNGPNFPLDTFEPPRRFNGGPFGNSSYHPRSQGWGTLNPPAPQPFQYGEGPSWPQASQSSLIDSIPGFNPDAPPDSSYTANVGRNMITGPVQINDVGDDLPIN